MNWFEPIIISWFANLPNPFTFDSVEATFDDGLATFDASSFGGDNWYTRNEDSWYE